MPPVLLEDSARFLTQLPRLVERLNVLLSGLARFFRPGRIDTPKPLPDGHTQIYLSSWKGAPIARDIRGLIEIPAIDGLSRLF